eukprot:TRINITY_DN17839_c0_g2_i1.p1 TRINITY_DN17839_c0_g2~~TRINITY_DN17839_c0_g2_i1.p1  ORF type:complete len:556 (-),score=143.27 TRINITY_DN17839_c0_g2_i1:154-1821(-)
MTAVKTFDEYQREKSEREWKEKVKKQKEAMNNAERVKRATDWKRIGNDKVKAGNLWEARDYYREAIIFVEDLVDARRKERNDLLMPLYANLAHVDIKLGETIEAEDVCSQALAIAGVERNAVPAALRAKAHFRRGMARRALGKLEDASEDLEAARKLAPENEEVIREAQMVRETLAAKPKQGPPALSAGFLNRSAARSADGEAATEKKRDQDKRAREAAERREERRRRAEEKQQMRGAFEKLSKGKMLYEAREKEMEPIREKEREKERTLELERDLLNIIDDSKGKPKTKDLEEFKRKKETQAVDQNAELDQKKKVLDKLKKEEQWEVDDQWRDQRLEHRRQIESRRAVEGTHAMQGPRSLWEAKEVARWCEQRIRDSLMGAMVEGVEIEPDVACEILGDPKATGQGYILRALLTDVLKLVGDASVMHLNASKPPLHYYDYFVKLDWEVAMSRRGERVYRSADELIHAAAKDDDMKAPASVAEHRLLAGTYKLREFCSEDEPSEGEIWRFETKIKRPCERIPELAAHCEDLCARLREKCARLLVRWAEEYREHWR